ncbi:MAG: pyridoxamine 5'-phosphate oxidase family protein [Acidimicrobiales bacterium]
MWIDDRGSEVLDLPECRRLLALGAKHHHHGHLGVPTDEAPLVLPLDYAVLGSGVVMRMGEGLFARVHGRLVAFQVDSSCDEAEWNGGGAEGRWSVLLRGPAVELDPSTTDVRLPEPRVAEPGHRLVHVRSDLVTGRRLRSPGTGPAATDR